ncbi:LacI family DNA-binding transcriptional regulator [Lysinibacillus sphaericus]|uniref:LacI family DNA-binding transcriptional regulator n=1 Tax=Lysinibacillus sphaericus TaxID=1421 RepID=UPI001C5F633F
MNIMDVAQKSGVSKTTVSRVLNNEKYVSDKTREKVLTAIQELGYAPNWVARSLVTNKTNLIGVIVPEVDLSFYYSIISEMEKMAFEKGYKLFICNTLHRPEKETEYLSLLKEMRVDGLILMHEELAEQSIKTIQDWGITCLFLSGEILNSDIPSVLIDNYAASKAMTEYLIRLGHKKINFIAGNESEHATLNSRLAGFLDGVQQSGKEITYNIAYGDYSMESGYKIMKKTLETEIHPTAVFAISDDIAVGAMNCLLDFGFQVPNDVSVAGFDASNISTVCRPRLTTVEQPIELLAKTGIELLIATIGSNIIEKKTYVPFQLLIRESCMSLKGGEYLTTNK